MINIDQPMTNLKQATAIGEQQQNEQIFFYLGMWLKKIWIMFVLSTTL